MYYDMEEAKMKKAIIILACAVFLCLTAAGCGGGSSKGKPQRTGDSDEMFDETVDGAEIDVYVKDGRVFTTEYGYELSWFPGRDDMEEGHFYRLTADVKFLNGGVAGYVDYPQIKEVISIEEIPAPEAEPEQEDEN